MAGWPAMFQPLVVSVLGEGGILLSSQCCPWSGGSRTFNLVREKWTLGRCMISCWKWWISISILDYRRVSILGIQIIYPYSVLFSCSFRSHSQGTPNGEARPEHRCLSVGRQLELWETALEWVIDMLCPTFDCNYHQHLLFSWLMGFYRLPGANSQSSSKVSYLHILQRHSPWKTTQRQDEINHHQQCVSQITVAHGGKLLQLSTDSVVSLRITSHIIFPLFGSYHLKHPV